MRFDVVGYEMERGRNRYAEEKAAKAGEKQAERWRKRFLPIVIPLSVVSLYQIIITFAGACGVDISGPGDLLGQIAKATFAGISPLIVYAAGILLIVVAVREICKQLEPEWFKS